MNKNFDPIELALIIAKRSQCSVKMGAVLFDKYGIFAWGWNSSGNGFGLCAERHALERANPNRFRGSAMAVAGFRTRNKNLVCACPCGLCHEALIAKGISNVIYQDKNERVIMFI